MPAEVARFVVTAMVAVPATDFKLTLDALVALVPQAWSFYKDGVQPKGAHAADATKLGAILHQRSVDRMLPKTTLPSPAKPPSAPPAAGAEG